MCLNCFNCCFPGLNSPAIREPLSSAYPGNGTNLSLTVNLNLNSFAQQDTLSRTAANVAEIAPSAIRILVTSTTEIKPLPVQSTSLKNEFNAHLDNCIATLLLLKDGKFASVDERNSLIEELKSNNEQIAQLVTNTLEQEKGKRIAPPLKLDLTEEKQELPLSIIPPSTAPPPVLVQPNLLYHDVRAPLHNIGLEIESYQYSKQSAQDLIQLTTILEKQYKELQAFIQSIPEQTAHRAQPLTAVHKPFTIKRLVQSVTHSTDASLKKRNMGVAFSHGTHPDTESFSGDMSKISHILTNFINNATKYCNPGTEIKVRISIDPTYSPRHSILRFEVEDNGPGISDEKKEKLFAAFSQAAPLSDTTQQSSGVGLYLSSQYAKVLNPGAPVEKIIGVRDGKPKGSCFWFTARLKKVNPLQSPVSSPVTVKLKFNDENVSILLADDSQSIQRAMGRVIETAGCKKDHFNIVGTGETAIDLYEEKDYQIIFLDENMGKGKSGCETAKALLDIAKENNRIPPHIIVTSGESKEEIEEKLEAFGLLGKVSVLNKPCTYSAIVQTVNRLTASSLDPILV